MPSAAKVGWAQLRVGIMAVIALMIIGALVFLLTGNKGIFSKDVKLYTYMDNSAAMAKGVPVRLNGILAGEVANIGLSGESTKGRIIKIEMDIQEEMLKNIPVDSLAAVSAENVLGTKFINIAKGKSPVPVQAGAEIRALDTAEFEEIVQQGYNVVASLQGIITRVDKIVGLIEGGRGSIGRLLVDEELYNRIIAIVSDGQKIAKQMTTDKGTLGKLMYSDELYSDVRGSVGRVNTVLDELNAGKGTAGKLLKDEALYNELQANLLEVRKVMADINAGKGTAGKLLKDEKIYNQLSVSLGKVDLIIDKVNAGQGTVGQLLVNPQLYDTLNGATGEMQQLIKDVRANPKKFLRIKLALF